MHSQKNLLQTTRSTLIFTRALTIVVGLVATSIATVALRAQPGGTAGRSMQAASVQTKRDSMTIRLEPLARTEVKLVMKKDQKAEFSWKSDGAAVTYNLHGEGPAAPGGKAHTYKRGESKAETGAIVAVFDGVHGWSWRNTSEKPVKITVTAWGQFSQLKKM